MYDCRGFGLSSVNACMCCMKRNSVVQSSGSPCCWEPTSVSGVGLGFFLHISGPWHDLSRRRSQQVFKK